LQRCAESYFAAAANHVASRLLRQTLRHACDSGDNCKKMGGEYIIFPAHFLAEYFSEAPQVVASFLQHLLDNLSEISTDLVLVDELAQDVNSADEETSTDPVHVAGYDLFHRQVTKPASDLCVGD